MCMNNGAEEGNVCRERRTLKTGSLWLFVATSAATNTLSRRSAVDVVIHSIWFCVFQQNLHFQYSVMFK